MSTGDAARCMATIRLDDTDPLPDEWRIRRQQDKQGAWRYSYACPKHAKETQHG